MPLLPPRTDLERSHIARAKRRLETLSLYPKPVRVERVRIFSVPWLFRLPYFSRFYGYEMGPLILIRRPLTEVTNNLITHEMTHVWQDQDHRARLWLSFLFSYSSNPHEIEAREAVKATERVA